MSSTISLDRRVPAAGIARASIATALVGLALALPATASAQTVIDACYVPASGTVYRIKAVNTPANCLQPTHVAFKWTDGADAFAALQDAVKKSDAAAGDVTGVFSNLTVGKLLGRALAATPPTDGQVLAWNQGTQMWEPRTVAGGGGGVSDHGTLTGLGDDDHGQYLLTGGVRNGSFAVQAPLGSGASLLSSTTPGNGGMLFHAPKAALRIGTGGSNEWSDANIGISSFAAGGGNIASGDFSVAFGSQAQATGSRSLAIGLQTKASGNNAVAIGQLAESAGASAIALGLTAKANGQAAVSLGGTASGENAVSLTALSVASGIRSAAIFGEATGNYSTAIRGNATGGSAIAIAGTASGDNSFSIGYGANTNNQSYAVVISSGLSVAATAPQQFVVRATRIWLGSTPNVTATANRFLETSTGAYLTTGGTWTNSSDSTVKTAFRAVDGEQVLGKVAALPLYTWQYRSEDSTVRHMGPTAQSFRAAFGLGDTEKAIATVDIDGVALAGVKALEQRTRTLQAEAIALREENAKLAARLEQLEAVLSQIIGSTTTARQR